MSFYCSHCRNVVPDGYNQCLQCKSGFTHALLCQQCNKVIIPRGATSCGFCDKQKQMVRAVPPMPPPSELAMVAPMSAPPALPGLPSHVHMQVIPETYAAGKFGVSATVTMPSGDVEILNKMGQVVLILHTLASDMNKFQGISETTRQTIRACRILATELQDEIESRRGPQG